MLSILRPCPNCIVDDRTGHPSAGTAFQLPGVPALPFLDDYSRLPIHTPLDTITLMQAAALAAAEVGAAAVRALLS